MPEIADARAVFWDIGGVILDVDSVQAVQRRFIDRLTTQYETGLDAEEALDRFRETVGAYFAEREGTTFRPAREGYRRGVDAILVADAAEVPWRSLLRSLRDEGIEPNPDAVAAIERLAETPLHQGIISDVDHEEGERLLEGLGVRRAMETYTSSEAVGRTKPDRAMFEDALERASVEPERAVMIGDRYEHDIMGAKRVG
ncbi:MAG: HAD family hydrolase, partial [Haloarculaceae archaeon]